METNKATAKSTERLVEEALTMAGRIVKLPEKAVERLNYMVDGALLVASAQAQERKEA
jgi:hypothetical protein